MNKRNCWEYMQCGLGPGGAKAQEQGECPVAKAVLSDGINGGRNAGRCCWIVSASRCNGEVQGDCLDKLGRCMSCGFYHAVVWEEGKNFVTGAEFLAGMLESAAPRCARH